MARKERKRIYLTVDPTTYNKLALYAKRNNFKNECEVVSGLIHIMLDRLESPDNRLLDIPDADGEYIDDLFDSMSHHTKQADGDGAVAITRRTKNYDAL